MMTLNEHFLARFSDVSHRENVLIRSVDARMNEITITEADFLSAVTVRAAFLRAQGLGRGNRIFLLCASVTDLTVFFWASLLIGAVPCPLYGDYGANALISRFEVADPAAVVADRLTAPLSAALGTTKSLKRVILMQEPNGVADSRQVVFPNPSHTDAVDLNTIIEPVDDKSPAFLIFTSGSTGFPKAVQHVHGIAPPILRSMRTVLNVQPGEVYWCTAHPAWITGTVYGIIGPIIAGVTLLQFSGAFHAKRWMPLLERYGVETFYTAPSALRALMRTDDSYFQSFALPKLRAIFSVGEPLNPAIFDWGLRSLNRPIYDTWFQSEAGTIRIANTPAKTGHHAIRPGRMGYPVDDTVTVLLDDDLNVIADSDNENEVSGKLALLRGWESAFQGYFGRDDLTESKFTGRFYLTGDLAARDRDGSYRFIGRDDDLINTSGHLLGPFEVETVLSSDPDVVEVAVVSAPDPLIFEHVAAFIVLKDGITPDDDLELRLRSAVTGAIAPYAAPKTFVFVDELPKNDAGKILRKDLRVRLRAPFKIN